ncbi:MAG: DUF4180 domain-containing protein [Candidatus Pacebacteria bacterium]|jgi:hypothetical protein|nr:DUF4180 domain-containing protein [Candidatus Paceibacterota bacterium]
METIICEKDGQKVAQVGGEEIIMAKVQDALDLMVDPDLERARMIIIDQKNIVPEFFDLSTRLAGEILQKFVQYRVKLAIVGDFSDASESLKAFIYESNKGQEIFFCVTADEAKERLFAAR